MKKWILTNKKGQIITVKAEPDDLPVAFSTDGEEPYDVINATDVEDIPEIDENTEEITIKKENLMEIPDGFKMTHKIETLINVKII